MEMCLRTIALPFIKGAVAAVVCAAGFAQVGVANAANVANQKGSLLVTASDLTARSTFGIQWKEVREPLSLQTCPALELSKISPHGTNSANFQQRNGGGSLVEQ